MSQMHSASHTGEGLCSVKAFLPCELYPKILMWLGITGNKPHVSGSEGRGVSESRQKAGEYEGFTAVPLVLLGWPGCVAAP